MIVDSWMSRDPVTVAPDTSVRAAAAIMTERNIRHLPVLRAGAVVGMVTRTDLLRGQEIDPFSLAAASDLSPQRAVRAVMSSPAVTTEATTPLEEAAGVMARRKLSALPVVWRSGSLVGIITDADVLRALISSLEVGVCTRLVFPGGDVTGLLAVLAPRAKAMGLEILAVQPSQGAGGAEVVVTVRGLHGDRLADVAWGAGFRVKSVVERR